MAEVDPLDGFKKVDWLKACKNAIQDFRESVVSLLTGNWLAWDEATLLGKSFLGPTRCCCGLLT